MTEDQQDAYEAGYWEAREVLLSRLRELVAVKRGLRQALEDLIDDVQADEAEHHWNLVQKESPGLTREQYDADLEAAARTIREKYYRPDGRLKVRPVRPVDGR